MAKGPDGALWWCTSREAAMLTRYFVLHLVNKAHAYAYSASAFFIFFIAATSIWRMRSALTP